MSLDSTVFHIIESVKLPLDSKSNKTSSPDIKMSMSECRALQFFSLIFPLRKQNQNLRSRIILPSKQVRKVLYQFIKAAKVDAILDNRCYVECYCFTAYSHVYFEETS